MYKYVKRFFDAIFSLIFIILFSPFMIITYVILKLELKGKIIFKQERIGLHKKEYTIYKFKTMIDDRSVPDEQRITKISKLIRKSGLDELPQLFNILKGDMSFVGPRPFMVNDNLPKNSYNPKRYEVRPGVLGYAQAKGRRNITHEDKIKWDLKYVDEISLWTDFKLFWMTIWTVLTQLK